MNGRVAISTFELFGLFPNAESARIYLEGLRWGGTPVCPLCGCGGNISERQGRRAGYYRCWDCGEEFTVRTGTIFGRSKVPLHQWVHAMYLVVTARKGVSSLQLSKEIGVTQKSAWFMLGRLREACAEDDGVLAGIVGVDETYIDGKERSKHEHEKLNQGRRTVGKQVVMGLRERGGKAIAKPVPNTNKYTLQGEIKAHVAVGSAIHTDEHVSYKGLSGYEHRAVNHSAGEYVGPGDIHVNGQESVWAVLNRSVRGTWHHVSRKHLGRYASECTFRLNDGNARMHTLDPLTAIVAKAFKVRITYQELTA